MNQYDLKYTQARAFYTDTKDVAQAYIETLAAIQDWYTIQVISNISFNLYEDGTLYAVVYYE
jgi:hypothetical protein